MPMRSATRGLLSGPLAGPYGAANRRPIRAPHGGLLSTGCSSCLWTLSEAVRQEVARDAVALAVETEESRRATVEEVLVRAGGRIEQTA